MDGPTLGNIHVVYIYRWAHIEDIYPSMGPYTCSTGGLTVKIYIHTWAHLGKYTCSIYLQMGSP